jgi:hypothetical protein
MAGYPNNFWLRQSRETLPNNANNIFSTGRYSGQNNNYYSSSSGENTPTRRSLSCSPNQTQSSCPMGPLANGRFCGHSTPNPLDDRFPCSNHTFK